LIDEVAPTTLALRASIDVPANRLYQLIAGKRSMTADTALRVGKYFGMAADFWMNLQTACELDLARQQSGKAKQRIPKRGEIAEPRPAA
jgi:antitoxin HigA-1